ncbi:MAG: hypothetical protein LBP22_09380 [Deltaproteobacteria bacterium]|jgi:drug/metabolite transporter (DMT)-like permease|nr:hypothetical protein [Deltaproteobacteria bacterium]
MQKLLEHSYLLFALFAAGLSQIIIRWQISQIGDMPPQLWEKILTVLRFLFRPWVLAALFSTFCSGLCWIITLTKFELSYAYPWTSLLYVYLLLAGLAVFGDSLTFNKVFGTFVIMLGVYFIAKG